MSGLRIARYLIEVRKALRVGPPFLERILAEIEAHLHDGAERELERGAEPEEAEQIVIERFGAPEAVARL